MKQETKQETKPKKKRTKQTIKRITALLLALLLAITVFPATTVFADGSSTHEGSSGAEHGGSSGSFGDDTDDSSQLISPPSLIINDDGTRTLNLNLYHALLKDGEQSIAYKWKVQLRGSGHFVIRSFAWDYENGKTNPYGIISHIFSDKDFTINMSSTNLVSHTSSSGTPLSAQSYNGLYYHELPGMTGGYNVGKGMSFVYNGYANVKHVTSTYPSSKDLIDSGDLDLEKDDYMPEDQIGKLTPVKDDSIGYLPRARYFDNRKENTALGNVQYSNVTSTIQWASFEEPYCSDLDNPYYIEVYADLKLALTDSISLKTVNLNARHHYKKYGEVKYINERLKFSYSNPFSDYLSVSNSKYDINDILYSETYVSAYYARLLHYDYDKQQLLCGGWTKLVPNDNGGCTSSTGDFPDGNPGDDDFVDDDDDPKDWGDDGWDPDPTPPNPDDPDDDDFGIDTSNIGAFILSAITSLLNAFKKILSLVGEFPDLCKHVFSFLPDEVNTLMFGGVAAIVVMRFLGR